MRDNFKQACEPRRRERTHIGMEGDGSPFTFFLNSMHAHPMAIFARRMASVQRSFIREILKVTEDPSIISFAGGLPNPRFFPSAEIADAASKILDEDGSAALQYATTEGYPPLRRWIADRYARRGLRVAPEEVLVLNGSQQGLDLVAKIFLNPGDAVMVERPTYLAALQAFALFEPSFVSVPLRNDGPDTMEMARALAQHSPRFCYAVPTFQNPSGISWSHDIRRRAAGLLAESSTVLIEDDPYGELRFAGEALPFIASLMGEGALEGCRVVLLGTFSKIAAPGLRLGWICAGREIMERLVVAKQAADLHSNGFAQRVLHRWLADHDLESHIASIRKAYGRQRDLMVELAGTLFPPGVTFTRPDGGMFLWVTLPEGCSSLELFERAVAEKVAFVPGQAFFADGGGKNTLRLNFSNSDEARIEEGMRRLARVLRCQMDGAGG
jgi:2-aminoadipate transaminase